MSIKVKDSAGIYEISYEQMQSFHGGDFYGGVALAYKICQGVSELSGMIDREDFVMFSAMHPPGVCDGIECVTRALSREHFVYKPSIAKDKNAPKAPCGAFYYEILHNKKKICLSLKDDLLPKGFTKLATKCKAGVCDENELAIWTKHKKDIGNQLISLDFKDIFNIKVI